MALNYQAAVNISAQFTGAGEVDKAKKSLTDLQRSATGTASAFGTIQGKVTGLTEDLGKKLVALFAAEKVFEYAKSIVELGDTFSHLQEKTGIGVQELSHLKTAAELGGVAFDELQSSLRKFQVNTAGAAAGIRVAQEGFSSLGITVRGSNGQLKPTGDLLLEVADKFSHMKDGAEKAKVAVALFGKTGTDLIPVLNEGREGLEKYGNFISEDFTQGSRQLTDSFILLGVNFRQFGIDALSGLLPALNSIVKAFIEVTSGGSDAKLIFEGIGEGLRQLAAIAVEGVEAIGAIWDTLKTLAETVVNSLVVMGKELYDTAYAGDALVKALSGNFSGALDSLKAYKEAAIADVKEFYNINGQIGQSYIDGLKDRAEKTMGIIGRLETGAGDKPEAKRKTATPDLSQFQPKDNGEVEKLRAQLEELRQKDALDLKRQRGDISDKDYQKQKVAIQDELAMKKEIAKLDARNPADAAKIAQIRQLTDAITKEKQAYIDATEAQKQYFSTGAKQAMQEYVERARDTAAQTKKLFLDAFQGLEDAIVNFVKTGKLSFKDLANTIEDELLHIAVRKAIAFGLTSAFGGGAFAMGGIMTSSGPAPLTKYASGGVADRPQVALFGEGSKPEAYVPLPDGRTIPVTMRGGQGSGGGNTSVQVNVTIAGDGSSQKDQSSDSDKGRQLGNMISSVVQSELVKQKRPGGLLA